jgi:hypothetical protein
MYLYVKIFFIFFIFLNQIANTYDSSKEEEDYGLNYNTFKNLFIKKYKKNIKKLTEVIIVDFDINYNGLETLNDFIKRRLYINADDNPDNNLDDDKDGYINNTYGINFLSSHSDPFSIFKSIYDDGQNDTFHEEEKHGFYMLQIIDKIALSPVVKIYPITVKSGEEFAKAVDWVVKEKERGANIRIVNLPATSFLKLHLYKNKLLFNEMKGYVQKLDDAGIILVVGAGNQPPVDSNPYALMDLKNVLSVSAHDRNGNILYKHDKIYIDFTVPVIFGLGTSESASIASAVIATYCSIMGDMPYRRMLDFIKNSIKSDNKFKEFTKFGGFLQYNEKVLTY